MRDPKRIPRVLWALEEYWRQNPDLRLGQILSNMAKKNGNPDPFYLEDDELEVQIKASTVVKV